MRRTLLPVPEDTLPPASTDLLARLAEHFGRPRLLLTAAHSLPVLAALEGWARQALDLGLSPQLREGILLRVAQLHGSDYCVAAYWARARASGLGEAEAERCRRGIAEDAREQALLSLATKIVEDRGCHAGLAVELAHRSGASDRDIVEVIQLVALAAFTSHLANVAGTEPEDPPVDLSLTYKSEKPAHFKDPHDSREGEGPCTLAGS